MPTIHRFGGFEFSTRTLELTRDGHPVSLAPQPARVLRILLEHPGTLLLREEIQERIWPDEPSRVTRNQGLNACIRQIRYALGEDASSPTFIQTLPRRGYRFFAPVETRERTGPGPTDVTRPGSGRPGPGRGRLVGAAAAALLGLLVVAGIRHAGPGPGATTTDHAAAPARLAVLPFEDLSAGSDRPDGFAPGLTEELTTRLASVDPRRLDIVAFASSRRGAAGADGPAEAGRRVAADYVLDGTVRREGSRIRVSARLVEVADGTHLWADQFEGEFASLLDLQASLGVRVTASVLPSLPGPRPTRSSPARDEPSPEARRPYLEGLHLLSWETPEGARAAVDRLRDAVRLDPGFAAGHAALGEALFWSGQRDLAERSARRALDLGVDVPEAHLVLGEVLLDRDFAFPEADVRFRRALELAPGRPEFHRAYAHYLTAVGRHDEAIGHLETARGLDPLSPALDGDAGWHLYLAGRYEEAARRCAELAPLMRGIVRARGKRCALQALVQLGRIEEARDHALAILELAGADEPTLAEVRDAPGRQALAVYTAWSLRPENRAVALGGDTPYTVARALADLGDDDRALASLEAALRDRPRGFLMVAVEPRFDRLRDHPRFRRLLRRIGYPAAPTDLVQAEHPTTES